MNVVHDAGARRLAQVHTKVESFGLVNLAQRRLAALGQIHQLVGSFLRRSIKLADVLERNYEQMPADVGVDIENNEIVLGAVQDEIVRVSAGVVAKTAEDAARWY